MGKFKTSKSYFLTGCLVAVSFAIINCQKAPNRNGVKPNVANPAGTNAKVEESGKTECTPEAKRGVEAMRKIKSEVNVTHDSSSGKTEAEKNSLMDKRTSFITNCDAVIKELDKTTEKACLLELKLKAGSSADEIAKNNISMTEMKQSCDATKAKLAEDKGTAADRTGTVDEEKRKKEEKERKLKQDRATEYLKTRLVLVSDEVKDLSKDKTAFKKYIVDGDIKSDSKALELANAKSIVCSIFGNEQIDKTVSKSVVMKFSAAYETISGESALEGFKGEAMTVALSRENDKSEKGMYDNTAPNPILLTLTCLNVKVGAMDIGDLKKALGIKSSGGKHISEISIEDLKKQTDGNAKRHADAKTEELAVAARAEEARRLAQGGTPPTTTTVTTTVAIVPATAAEKPALVQAVTAAREALSRQETTVQGLKGRVALVKAEDDAAKKAISDKKLEGADFVTFAKSIISAGVVAKRTEAASVEANKGKDQALKAKAKTEAAEAKTILTALQDSKSEKVIAVVATGLTVQGFVDLYVKSENLAEKLKSISKELETEEGKIADLKKIKDTAVKTALDKKVTEQELAPATAAAVVPAAAAAAPNP